MNQIIKRARVFTVCRVGGVVDAGPRVGVRGGSSTTEPVPLVDSPPQVAPAAPVALKVAVSRRRTLSVCELYVVKSYVSLLGGAGLHAFHHDLERGACLNIHIF